MFWLSLGEDGPGEEKESYRATNGSGKVMKEADEKQGKGPGTMLSSQMSFLHSTAHHLWTAQHSIFLHILNP